MGDSIVRHGYNYATSTSQENLGQTEFKVVWKGKAGMHWDQLLPTLQYLMLIRGQPKMIVLHLGGNDIDNTELKQFIANLTRDILYINSVFPKTHIAWCDILPRLQWRNNTKNDPKTLNIKRKRINRAARACIKNCMSGSVLSPNIQWYMTELFNSDGVHLSEFGNMVYIQTLKKFLVSNNLVP